MKKTIASLLSWVILLSLVACNPPASGALTRSLPSSSSPALQSEPPIQEGWIRLKIKNVGSIDYPPAFLELQSGFYRDVVTEAYQVLGLNTSDFTLQQTGLNELEPLAFETYRRVILRTEYLKSGQKMARANEKYRIGQNELAELETQLKAQTGLESVSVEIGEVNGMFPLVQTYIRPGVGEYKVLVKTYTFQNYDKIHYLTFSCRLTDEGKCKDIYQKILYSFRLQNL